MSLARLGAMKLAPFSPTGTATVLLAAGFGLVWLEVSQH
jgi:hypothetical protein